MAQPNVVREPSMDEILASIRRIIESNEPLTQGGLATGLAEPEGFSGSAANDDSDAVSLTVDSTFEADGDMGLSSPSDREVEQAQSITMMDMPYDTSSAHKVLARENEAVPQKSLSLADVAARVRAASERNVGLNQLTAREPEQEAEPEPQERYDPPSSSNPLVTSRMNFSGMGQTGHGATSLREDSASVSAFEPLADLSPASNEVAADTVQEPAGVALLSGNAGEQVARSFQDLALAVDQAERRSYDEIAADLLRPMLQEWLDDNLPTLVERLVREEIERVARGSRR